ncbi:MAG: hypothetical protein QN130_12290 [Armatimonadota bacterium]|nr:hypothetical protein [Armatimonadota bacterium]
MKLTAEQRKELGQYILDAWTQDNRDRQIWLDNLARWLDAYQGRPRQKDTPWEGASNLHVPVTATVIETHHPRIMAALFRPQPIVSFRPQEPSDEPRARAREAFLDWACREEINLFPVMDRVVLNTLIYGVQPVKVSWELQVRKVRDRHQFPLDTPLPQVVAAVLQKDLALIEAVQRVAGSDQIMARVGQQEITLDAEFGPRYLYVYTDREEVVRDAPYVCLVKPEDFVVEADAPYDLQRADHVIHRYWLTPAQLKREIAAGIFELSEDEWRQVEATAQKDKLSSSEGTDFVKLEEEAITGVQTVTKQGLPEHVEILEAYFRWDVDGDGVEEELLVTIPKDAPHIVLRAARLEEVFRHGRRPFVLFYFNPVADSIWAIGVPQVIEGLQQEFNTIHNLRTDAGMIANTPFGVYVPAAGFNPERMPIRPGYMYPVDDVNAVRWYSPPSALPWAFQEEAGLWMLLERRTKVSDLTLGRIGETQGAARTASGAQILASQQAAGFDIYIRRFQEGFRELLRQILALYQQYMPPGKLVRIVGAPGEPSYVVDRESLRGDMDMVFTGNSLSTDRQVERETMTFLAQGVLSPGALTMLLQLGLTDPAGVGEWYRNLLRVFDVPGVERIIKLPEVPVLLSPKEVLTRVVQGERVIPQRGEDHRAVMELLQQELASPEALSWSPEVRLLVQRQIAARAQAIQMEQVAQLMQAIQMAQMAQLAPLIQTFGGVRAPAFGGPPPEPPRPEPPRAAF